VRTKSLKVIVCAAFGITAIGCAQSANARPLQDGHVTAANDSGTVSNSSTDSVMVPNLPCRTCGGGGTGPGDNSAVPIPPEKFATSPGGFDMRSGRYLYDHLDLSIGGEHGIELHRLSVASDLSNLIRFGEFISNWTISVTESRGQTPEANQPSEYDYQVSVNYGGKSASFQSHYNPSPDGLGAFNQVSNDGHAILSFVGHTTSNPLHPYPFMVPDYYIFTAKDGTKVTFRNTGFSDCIVGASACAFASKIDEPDGTHYDLSYDTVSTGARLRSIVSNRGYALLMEYNVSGYPLATSKACVLNLATTSLPDIDAAHSCPAGAIASTYSYSSGKLTSYVDQSGVATLADGISRIYNPGEANPYVTIASSGPGYATETFSDGRYYNYVWDTFVVGNKTETVGGKFTDNNGKTVTVKYGHYNFYSGMMVNTIAFTVSPESIVDENGRITTANYCLSGTSGDNCVPSLPRTITNPEGDYRSFTYDSYRNVTQTVLHAKPGSGLTDVVTNATFSNCSNPVTCAKPLTTTDARGKVTNFSYNAAHGGVIYELDPADAAGVRPGKYYTYVQRYAWVKSGSGYAHASGAVWLPATMVTCRTTALNTTTGTCGGGTADMIKTTYDYGPDAGPNNLLLRGVAVTADGKTERTCYGYNAAGDKIWETKPNAGLATCP